MYVSIDWNHIDNKNIRKHIHCACYIIITVNSDCGVHEILCLYRVSQSFSTISSYSFLSRNQHTCVWQRWSQPISFYLPINLLYYVIIFFKTNWNLLFFLPNWAIVLKTSGAITGWTFRRAKSVSLSSDMFAFRQVVTRLRVENNLFHVKSKIPLKALLEFSVKSLYLGRDHNRKLEL